MIDGNAALGRWRRRLHRQLGPQGVRAGRRHRPPALVLYHRMGRHQVQSGGGGPHRLCRRHRQQGARAGSVGQRPAREGLPLAPGAPGPSGPLAPRRFQLRQRCWSSAEPAGGGQPDQELGRVAATSARNCRRQAGGRPGLALAVAAGLGLLADGSVQVLSPARLHRRTEPGQHRPSATPASAPVRVNAPRSHSSAHSQARYRFPRTSPPGGRAARRTSVRRPP